MSEIVQNSLSSGELSPHLYGRTDLAKYHSGAMFMRNFYVDYRGGATGRPGTQLIGQTGDNNVARLRRFVFSTTQTYMLVFVHQGIQIIRNPLTPGHLNGSNAGFIETTPTVRVTITTPYDRSELSSLKFSQSADVLIITHPSHPAFQLTRVTDTNWTFVAVNIGSDQVVPTSLTAVITALPAGSTDPVNTNYNYLVTAVGQNGQESQASGKVSITGINIATTQGTVTLHWNGSVEAAYYNVYKSVTTTGLVGGAAILVPPSANFGFVGTAYGEEFIDTNIIPDFSQSPPSSRNPLANGRVIGFNITNPGAGYPTAGTTATITDPNSSLALLVPILSSNVAGATAPVTGFFIDREGRGITNGASIVVSGGGGAGFVGTVITDPVSGAEPAISSYFQGRRIYAGSNAAPLTIQGSKTGLYNNFDKSNPPLDSDAFEFTLAQQEVNAIRHLLSMPGGLVIFSDGGVVQLTGGSGSATNPSAVTPASAVITPQSYYGASNVVPIAIDKEILYVQTEGSIVRDLTFNLFVNMYSSTDLTLLSNHLFAPFSILEWAYQDVPNKIVWSIRSDGSYLSLTYLKEQDVYGWAQHYTQGLPVSIETVREGTEDAVYMVVKRNGNYNVERFCGQRYFSSSDAWCLDSALSLPKTFPAAILQPGAGANFASLTNVPFSTDVPIFSPFDTGRQIAGYGVPGIAIITSVTNSQLVLCTIVQPWGLDPANPTQFAPVGMNAWTIVSASTIVGGLTHLNGLSVYALVDGAPQGPFTVIAGSITLTQPGFSIVVGLKYVPQLQQLPPTGTGPSSEGIRDRTVAVTVRLMNTGSGINIGQSFDMTDKYVSGFTSTDEAWNTPYQPGGLVTGDQRMNLNTGYGTQGGICVQMLDPLPVTVLSLISEIAP